MQKDNFFTLDEVEKITKLKILSTTQVVNYCKIDYAVLLEFIHHNKETGFPLLDTPFHRRNYKILAEALIEWREKLHSKTLPKKQLTKIQALIDKVYEYRKGKKKKSNN